MTGIEYFVNLEILQCSENEIKAIDISRNTALMELDCSYNNLSTLDVINCISLQKLICFANPIQSFDVSTLPINLYNLALLGKWENENENESITCLDGLYLLSFPKDIVLYDGKTVIYQYQKEEEMDD